MDDRQPIRVVSATKSRPFQVACEHGRSHVARHSGCFGEGPGLRHISETVDAVDVGTEYRYHRDSPRRIPGR
jgi:hypothetical protein